MYKKISQKIINKIKFTRDIIPKDISPKTNKKRILCFTANYPEFSETYMHEEFVALNDEYEILIIAIHASYSPRKNALPFIRIRYKDENLFYGELDKINLDFTNPEQIKFVKKIDNIIEQFQPDILHGHYVYYAWLFANIADRYNLPFTIRTHSFDMLDHMVERKVPRQNSGFEALKHPMCKAVLAFPEFSKLLESKGINKEKIYSTWPIANIERFYHDIPKEPTKKILCSSPCIKKKAHHDFIDLAVKMQGMGYEFTLNTKGAFLDEIKAYNKRMGSPVEIYFTEPENMGQIYKQFDWIVYPSDPKFNRVGLPVSIMEAQASGIGICLQESKGRRSAQEEFLGGAGYLYNTIDEVIIIITNPYPEEMRLIGLENAKKSDIKEHKKMLMGIFNKATK